MREEKPEKPLWPKTPLQWLGVLAMVWLALNIWDVVMENFREPFPELKRQIEDAQRENEEFRRLVEEANKDEP